MTVRAALLEYADNVLDGSIALGPRAARTAALLARLALEDWLNEESASWSSSSEKPPTMNSKLVVLGRNRGAEVGERVRRAWHSLSRAVHHHAYELQPSVTEVRHLVGQVRAFCCTNSTTAIE
ncbi:hypothetical protein MINTM006_22870 [Mycobacterium intracellulare]|nr:hypothetical protein CKJ58_10070 [Mycobacterium intracellulare subsp. chimaera]BCO62337.1 hypothetical protein MINTM006_22870 [Mycobacterium intracellulare]PBA55223.1 hypothetical protein CKJ57_11165 [Mycobacterium intracellulare subsp. chimaera]PBA63056.1 hypothetical protein CKJ56_09425 [Mycobacterium intracellulare subsp. chimaera]BCP20603.1 hypothetical protein MINTM023_23920 [Mycobacterium intracellulare]